MSRLPQPGRLLVETFPHAGLHHLCLYGFAGRNAHQTLGLLLTRRMEEAGLHPLGFVATDYALLIWGLDPVTDPAALLDPGGAARGAGGLARRECGDEAHLPQRRDHGRADRAQPARAAQDRAAGDILVGHPLRHACAGMTPAT